MSNEDSRQTVFVPKRHVPSGERLEPGHGRPVKVNPPPCQRPNRQRGSEAARKAAPGSTFPAAPARNPPLPTKKRYDCFARQKKVSSSFLPPVRFPLAAGGSARPPAVPRESPSLSIFQSTAATKGRLPPIGGGWQVDTRWRACLTRSRLDLAGFESSRRTQVRAARRSAEAEMHKSKGKLSGVLHKGFKPDKWSVEMDFCCSRGAGGWAT